MIVVEVEKHRYAPGAGVWWDIATAETSNDPQTRKLREEYEEDQQKQRFYY